MKYLKYAVLLIFTLIWIIALSPELSRKMTIRDSYRYGDLYRLSNLSKFRDPHKKCDEYQVPARPASKKKVHLYILGDSFTEAQRLGKKDFAVDEYTYVHWSRVLHVKLDTAQTNIFLIEVVERNFREKFYRTPIQNIVPDTATFIDSTYHQRFMDKLDNAFASNQTRDRLDEILFQNDFMIGIKQLKADFNLHWFDRTVQEVTRVNGGENIVYYQDTDTDTTKTTSSFATVGDQEIDSLVTHLNQSKLLADKIGFDAVLLSVIPNKVSVLMPEYGNYNNLINRIQNHPKLAIPFVDIYADFRKMKDEAYLKGDSHWTCAGQYHWLDKVNERINLLTSNGAL